MGSGLAAEELLGLNHRGHGAGPSGVEGDVSDCLFEFGFGVAVVLGQAEVVDEFFGGSRVASTVTVTRLRSLGDRSVRGHTSPKSTSSVKCTKAGANSPKAFCAPEGSLPLLISVVAFRC